MYARPQMSVNHRAAIIHFPTVGTLVRASAVIVQSSCSNNPHPTVGTLIRASARSIAQVIPVIPLRTHERTSLQFECELIEARNIPGNACMLVRKCRSIIVQQQSTPDSRDARSSVRKRRPIIVQQQSIPTVGTLVRASAVIGQSSCSNNLSLQVE